MKESILFITDYTAVFTDINSFLIEDFEVTVCSFNNQIASSKIKSLDIEVVLINLQNKDFEDMFALKSVIDNAKNKCLPIVVTGTKSECENFDSIYNKVSYNSLVRPIQHLSVFNSTIKKIVSETKIKDKNILLIDDDGRFLRSMKQILEDDYNVSLANSAMTATASIARNFPDLVLLDYEMPVCDGQKLLEMIRTTDETRNLPVIILTGVKDKDRVIDIVSLNVQGYILKGTEAKDILIYIKDFFIKKKLE